MEFSGHKLTWFDLLLVGLVIFGIIRGRKRGMSEEMLDVFQWLTIIVVGALLYQPLGKLISFGINSGLFFGYVGAYIFIALMIKLTFTAMKRAVGEKLVHADAFGSFEYYLGMMAGALRFFCIVLFCMSLLHAKYISEAERLATAKMQADNFGSISFPTIGSLQQTVFRTSVMGKFIVTHLQDQLIEPVGTDTRRAETIGQRRERAVEEVMK